MLDLAPPPEPFYLGLVICLKSLGFLRIHPTSKSKQLFELSTITRNDLNLRENFCSVQFEYTSECASAGRTLNQI